MLPAALVRLVFLLLLLLFAVPSEARAETLSAATVTPSAAGPVLEFDDGEFLTADGLTASGQNWMRAAMPNIHRLREQGWRTGDFHNLTGRFRFDRRALGNGPQAIYVVSARNQFAVLVNGREVYRNFATPGDQVMAWYRPYLVTLGPDLLQAGTNTIQIHLTSQDSVGIGRIIIGPDVAIRSYYQSEYFSHITAPLAANFAMLVIGFMIFLLWLGRRQEIELFWLSLSTPLWFLRNYQYFAEVTPFDLLWFNVLSVHATYYASVTTAAFYVYFTRLPGRGRLVLALLLLGIPICVAQSMLLASNMVIYIPTTLVILGVALLALLDLNRHRDIEHGVLGLSLLIMPLASLYDMSTAGWHRGWNGSGFYFSVFGGLLYCIAFLASFGKRALDAFTGLGEANAVLEQRIAETRAELAASEAARQQLVVTEAVSTERGRLMQEMHDGIGSNLITALAVARQQRQPESTIKTLNRALADLKITVDSLEPVEGDVVALVGNLRHRMARDLSDAGIACKWFAEPCAALPWLDAANALHVLRILQEAIGNVLTHSGATQMLIGCRESRQSTGDGMKADGVEIYVADNGIGFAENPGSPGKGLANMRARATSLHGTWTCDSTINVGTSVTLWLPYARAS